MASTGEGEGRGECSSVMDSCNSALLYATLRRHVAVNGHNGARGEGALWAEEEGNGVGHVVDGAKPAHGRVASYFIHNGFSVGPGGQLEHGRVDG